MKMRTSLLGEILQMALRSIWAHKLRTFLTLLGMIIGVASVVVVGAGLEGAQKFVTDSVSKALGSNSFILARFARFGNVSDEDWQRMLRRNPDLTMQDLEFVRSYCRDCAEVTAQLGGNHTVYRGRREALFTQINGVTANTIFLGNFEVEEGRFFSTGEAQSSALVCVIGTEVKEELFPETDAVGKTLKLANEPLRVLGVLEALGSNFGQSQDRVLYLPIQTYRKIFGGRRSITIRGKAVSRERFDSALDQVRVAMRIRHKLEPDEDDDFGLISTDEINNVVDQFAAIVAGVVIPITLISLVVGGIVIMNIMLVSVTERTFEIGLRKALGARQRDIRFQFLLESFIVAAIGGVIGLGVATALAALVEAAAEFPMQITVGYVVMSIAVSGGIGIVSGLYPAFKASGLDPVIAMTEGK